MAQENVTIPAPPSEKPKLPSPEVVKKMMEEYDLKEFVFSTEGLTKEEVEYYLRLYRSAGIPVSTLPPAEVEYPLNVTLPYQEPIKFIIKSLAWNGEYWLIGGVQNVSNRGAWKWSPLLLKYDGKTLTDLSDNLNLTNCQIDKIAWNGKYWLLRCSFESYGGIVKYDGRKFSELPLSTSCVSLFEWNGSCWLIACRYPAHLFIYDGRKVKKIESNLSRVYSITLADGGWVIAGKDEEGARKLLNFDGRQFHERVGIDVAVEKMVWNGKYLLIAGWGKLYRYDGARLQDLTQAAGFGDERISALAWNGRYWLIGGAEGSLKRYDGNEFENLASNLRRIEEIAWNGEYWLIVGEDGKIVMFDGENFYNISEDIKIRNIEVLGWNGNYWLVGGYNALKRYDGKLVEDLTSEIVHAGRNTGDFYAIIVAAAVILILLAAIIGRKL